MDVFPTISQLKSIPAYAAILHALQSNEDQIGLQDAVLYHTFPLYRDDEGGLVVADFVLLSRRHGVVPFALSSDRDELSEASVRRCREVAEQVPSFIQSRLIKNRAHRKGPTRLAGDIQPVGYAPFLGEFAAFDDLPVIRSERELRDHFAGIEKLMPAEMFRELVATIEGA